MPKGTLSTKSSNILPNLKQNQDSPPLIITAYGPKLVVQKHFTGPGRTRQAHKDECDINRIMARYQQTGVIDFVNKHQAQYGDATGRDFQEAMQLIAESKTLFQDLPSSVRDRFKNDPALFLDFVHDPANEAEMHELGLMAPGAKTPKQREEAAIAAKQEAEKPRRVIVEEKPKPKPE